jgi:hypothetical protein
MRGSLDALGRISSQPTIPYAPRRQPDPCSFRGVRGVRHHRGARAHAGLQSDVRVRVLWHRPAQSFGWLSSVWMHRSSGQNLCGSKFADDHEGHGLAADRLYRRSEITILSRCEVADRISPQSGRTLCTPCLAYAEHRWAANLGAGLEQNAYLQRSSFPVVQEQTWRSRSSSPRGAWNPPRTMREP